MDKTVYVELRESPTTGYISVSNMFHMKDLESKYEHYVEICKSIGNRYESLKGYELSFLLLTVTYDGRKEV